jgi:anhydro-N-acetylmuramic acid kinase
VLATLTAFSAACVAQDLRLCRPVELLVAGGGARNLTLMAQLRQRCLGTSVVPLASRGIADQQREALAFALLAWWQQRGHRGHAPSVTGARTATVLGVCAKPAAGRGSGQL